MKKTLLMLLFATAFAGVISCQKSPADTTTMAESTQTEAASEATTAAPEPTTSEPETLSETTEAKMPASTVRQAPVYTIKELTMVGDSYTLSFPQLEGGDEITCHFYNWLWQRLAEDYAAQTTADPELSYTLNFQVMTHTEDLLSVLFKGQSVYADAAYPTNFFVAFNIDLRTGETLRLAEHPNLSDIVAALADGKFTFPDNYAYLAEHKDQIFSGYNASMLNTRLSLADYKVELTKGGLMLAEDQNPTDFTYYEDGELRILVQVVHALGDYVAVVPTTK